jgi:hypothetical protein
VAGDQPQQLAAAVAAHADDSDLHDRNRSR